MSEQSNIVLEKKIKEVKENFKQWLYEDINSQNELFIKMPDDINNGEIRDKIISGWNEHHISSIGFNRRLYDSERSTILAIKLEDAAKYIKKYFTKPICMNILELVSGNCKASSTIKNKLEEDSSVIKINRWIATDIIDYASCGKNGIEFEKLNTVDAVKKYGSLSNILLLISPQPGDSYSDYYACYDFIKQTKADEDKYIIIIGELGKSDGSHGMYDYMISNPELQLVTREIIFDIEPIISTIVHEIILGEPPNLDCEHNHKNNDVYDTELPNVKICSDIIGILREEEKKVLREKGYLFDIPKRVVKEIYIFKIKKSVELGAEVGVVGGYYKKYLKYKNKYLELKKYL